MRRAEHVIAGSRTNAWGARGTVASGERLIARQELLEDGHRYRRLQFAIRCCSEEAPHAHDHRVIGADLCDPGSGRR